MEKVKIQQNSDEEIKQLAIEIKEYDEIVYRRQCAERGCELYVDWVKRYWTSRGEPLDFEDHGYLKQIYEDQSPVIDYMKSAQSGATEKMITEAMWIPDQFKENSIYFFPTSGTISDLVQERIDEPINNNEYLSRVSGRAKKIMGKQADKIGLKRMSKGFVYFRGSNKPSQITSIAGDAIFVDELDRMLLESVPYMPKRLAHSKRKWQRWASTPTLPNFGIHKRFLVTDQHHWFVKCNHCDVEQEVDFFENVEFKMRNDNECEWARILCKSCKDDIVPYKLKGRWIAQNPDSSKRGYFMSKMYSPYLNIKEMVESSQKASEFEIQQFYNQDLGVPYEPKGGKLGDDVIDSAVRDYKYNDVAGSNYMGIDVGTNLHFIIMNDENIVKIGSCKSFDDLDKEMNTYNVKKAVIDALPETRKAQEFANRFKGRVLLCYYTGLKEVKKDEWFILDKENKQKLNTDRTMSLDMFTGRIRRQQVGVPKHWRDIPEFKEHMQNLTRMLVEKKDGSETAQYVKTGPDHLYHAGNYSNLARAVFNNTTVPEVWTF